MSLVSSSYTPLHSYLVSSVSHCLTLSGRSLQSQPFHCESFYVTGTPPLYVPLSLPHLTPFLPRYGSSFTPFIVTEGNRGEWSTVKRDEM